MMFQPDFPTVNQITRLKSLRKVMRFTPDENHGMGFAVAYQHYCFTGRSKTHFLDFRRDIYKSSSLSGFLERRGLVAVDSVN